jgi:hypothetical protein
MAERRKKVLGILLTANLKITLIKCSQEQERVHKIWAKVECGEYHVTAVSLRHYERNRVNACFLFL